MSRVILPWSDTVSSEPAVEPVSVAEAKRNSDVDGDDRDVDFQRWIKAARQKVETEARMCLVTQTRIRAFDCLPGRIVPLMGPLVSVSSIQYKDTSNATQTYASSNYDVVTARNAVFRKVTSSWPSVGDSPDVLTITYVCGKAASSVDSRALQAIFLLVKHWYENPSAFTDGQQYEVPSGFMSLVSQLKGGQYP